MMAVLFDLDGTILGAREPKTDIMKRCCEKIGVSEITREEYLNVFRRIIESGKIETRKPIFEEILGDESLAEELSDEYQKQSLEITFFYQDTEEVLQKLIDMGIKRAIVSNGPSKTQWDKIRKFDLQKYFDEIVISGEIGIAKPNPEIYKRALNGLGSKSSDSYFVSDIEDPDIIGAQNVGLKSILIRRGKNQGASISDYSIDDMRDLIKILKGKYS